MRTPDFGLVQDVLPLPLSVIGPGVGFHWHLRLSLGDTNTLARDYHCTGDYNCKITENLIHL